MRFLNHFANWYDTPATRGHLFIAVLALTGINVVIFAPWLWMIWVKL